jgi:F0F1-type ATP synthase epsilon subunit
MAKPNNTPTNFNVQESALQAPVNQDEDHQIHVKIYAPFKTYFDGFAKSISGLNATGPFDILPKHHNFMTLLEPCDLVVRTLKDVDEKYPIERGLMIVQARKVAVFLNI